MGRKKINITYIDNKKERGVTFCKRKVGLLKKAAELAVLCGVKVSLVFSDLQNNIHTFSNTDYFKFIASREYADTIKHSNIYTYDIQDYPFDKFGEVARSLKDIDLNLDNMNSLEKRDYQDVLNQSDSQVADIITKKIQNRSTNLNIEKIENTSNLGGNGQPQQQNQQDPLKKDKENLDFALNLTNEQILRLMTFDTEINDLILKGSSTDEELIILLTLKHLITIYFSKSADSRDPVIQALRKISQEDILIMLSSIKFKDKHVAVITSYITIINDILLDLILNPSNFNKGSFHFGSLIAKGGKAIMGIYTFLIKNLFQQLHLLRTQFSGDDSCTMNQLYSTESSNSDIAYLAKRIKVIKKIVENTIFALGLGSPKIDHSSDNKTQSLSGFKLHSTNSIKSLKSEDKNNLLNTLSESENFFKLAGGKTQKKMEINMDSQQTFDMDLEVQMYQTPKFGYNAMEKLQQSLQRTSQANSNFIQFNNVENRKSRKNSGVAKNFSFMNDHNSGKEDKIRHKQPQKIEDGYQFPDEGFQSSMVSDSNKYENFYKNDVIESNTSIGEQPFINSGFVIPMCNLESIDYKKGFENSQISLNSMDLMKSNKRKPKPGDNLNRFISNLLGKNT